MTNTFMTIAFDNVVVIAFVIIEIYGKIMSMSMVIIIIINNIVIVMMLKIVTTTAYVSNSTAVIIIWAM